MSVVHANPFAPPLAAFSLAALVSVISMPIVADEFGNPPVARFTPKAKTQASGAEAWSAPDTCPSDNDICYTLDIRYVTGKIRNPNFTKTDYRGRGYDYVKLRSYCGNTGKEGTDEDNCGVTGEEMEFVAPQVELKPGDTFRLTLDNQLAKAEDMNLPWAETACNPEDANRNHNTPHCANFNLTNMHTHGLWVSPVGNSDNVLLTINPGTKFTYEYNIPEDHPAGTFWYHSHRHGSTAPQVASGMTGAIIIRSKREPQLDKHSNWEKPGDIDVLLPRPSQKGNKWRTPTFPERVMLFQQIVYACRWTQAEINALPAEQVQERDLYPGKIKRRWDEESKTEAEWLCDTVGSVPDNDLDKFEQQKLGMANVGRIGTVEPGPVGEGRAGVFDQFGIDRRGSNVWQQSKRHTSINGTINKTFPGATAGKVERWRLIHGGVRETIRLQIRKVGDKVSSNKTTEEQLADILTKNTEETTKICLDNPDNKALKVMGLATDGLTRPALDERSDTWLQPGYREDILVSFPEPGIYCIFNAAVGASDNINAEEKNPAVLGFVHVKGSAVKEQNAAKRIINTLIQSAKINLCDKTTRKQVINDLQNGGKLSGFVWHQPIGKEELSGQQTLAFQFAPNTFHIGKLKPANVGLDKNPLGIEGIELPPKAGVEEADKPRPYVHNEIDRTLPLGKAEEWLMSAFSGRVPVGHPFHIHVNPFQIVAIWKYPDDTDIRVDLNDFSTWKDVSKPGSGGQYAGLKDTWKDTIFVEPGHLVQTRTRYERYIGNFVLHCHILDHEDQGMMQNVRIALPDGRGGFDAHDILCPRDKCKTASHGH